MAITVNHPLVRDINSVFHVSPSFVVEYMACQNFPSLEEYATWAEFSSSLDALQYSYVEFAMTCVLRARDVLALIQPRFTKADGARYLDVGCGYGGFVREFALRGYEAVGVELQHHLARFSAANCEDMPNATVVNEDFLAAKKNPLGDFDVITCNDVIEHVADPLETMNRMVAMLRPGGVLFMEIPNRDCIEFVIRDGHFQQFGITQLERNAASAYLQSMAGRSDYLREMGELYELDFYVDSLRNAGCIVDIMQNHIIGGVEDFPRLASNLAAGYSSWSSEVKSKADIHLARHMAQRLSEYQAQLWLAFANLQRGVGRKEFELRYLNSFWSVVAQRSLNNL